MTEMMDANLRRGERTRPDDVPPVRMHKNKKTKRWQIEVVSLPPAPPPLPPTTTVRRKPPPPVSPTSTVQHTDHTAPDSDAQVNPRLPRSELVALRSRCYGTLMVPKKKFCKDRERTFLSSRTDSRHPPKPCRTEELRGVKLMEPLPPLDSSAKGCRRRKHEVDSARKQTRDEMVGELESFEESLKAFQQDYAKDNESISDANTHKSHSFRTPRGRLMSNGASRVASRCPSVSVSNSNGYDLPLLRATSAPHIPGVVSPQLRKTYALNFFRAISMASLHTAYLTLFKSTEQRMGLTQLKELLTHLAPHCVVCDESVSSILSCFSQDAMGMVQFREFFSSIGSLIYGESTHAAILYLFSKLESLGPVQVEGSIPTARLTSRHVEHIIQRGSVPGVVVHKWLLLCEKIELYFEFTRENYPLIDLETFVCFVYLRDDFAQCFKDVLPRKSKDSEGVEDKEVEGAGGELRHDESISIA